ncbi:hypothetical protein ST47_g8870 [Ascochyta rabiei]|uniref:Uncharacterized protein n=1 Tax=Didymella rabiei TaxID=5454 RepID=A0A162YES1_DIDRA|nr:hypothetical protein ST47_g8870 [Ascochyta rabiei]
MDTNYTSRDLATATTTATATPANPLLASSFLTTSDLTALLKDQTHPAASTAPEEQETHPPNLHIPTLDSALAAPFHSGTVVALSSASPSPRNGVAQTLLVDCLFRSGDSGVAVVDTTGDFDVVGLYARILRRVDEQCFVFESGGGDGEVDVQKRKEGRAAELLDRVRILRVFDFVGVREAIGELSGELEGRRGGGGGGSGGGEESGDGSVVAEEENKKVVVDGEEAHAPPPRRTEVADSEDEEGDDELETQDEEMLFDIEEQTTEETSAPAPVSLHSTPHTTSQRNTWQPNIAEKPSPPKLNLILIDNLAHVLLPLLKKDSIQGKHTLSLHPHQSQLTPLFRRNKPLNELPQHPRSPNTNPQAAHSLAQPLHQRRASRRIADERRHVTRNHNDSRSRTTRRTAAAAATKLRTRISPSAEYIHLAARRAGTAGVAESVCRRACVDKRATTGKAGRAGVLRGERGWGEEKKKKNKGGGDGVCD